MTEKTTNWHNKKITFHLRQNIKSDALRNRCWCCHTLLHLLPYNFCYIYEQTFITMWWTKYVHKIYFVDFGERQYWNTWKQVWKTIKFIFVLFLLRNVVLKSHQPDRFIVSESDKVRRPQQPSLYTMWSNYNPFSVTHLLLLETFLLFT